MHPFLHPHSGFHSARGHHSHPRHAGRHDPRGFAGFGGGRHGFADDPTGAGFDGLGRGRKLGAVDLQLLLLALLAERPSHGYELIKALDERSAGYYSPSPGMVYPSLTHLEELGHASVTTEGNKKRYQLTPEGQAHLDSQRSQAEVLLQQLTAIGERMARMRRAMQAGGGHEPADDAPAAGRRGRHRGPGSTPALDAARQNLRAAIGERAGAPIAEQMRIAAILEGAAADIRAAGTPDAETP